MSARTKPLKVVEPSAVDGLTVTENYELPPAKGQVKMIDKDNIGELVRLLKEEAKVI